MAQIILGPNRAYPGIPAVSKDLENHVLVLEAVREAIGVHERRTRNVFDSFVRLQELVDLGIVNIDENTGVVIAPDDDSDASDSHNHNSLYIRQDGTSPATTGVVDFGDEVEFVNDKGVTFLALNGADDGTRIYRATGDALRIEFDGNVGIIRSLGDLSFQFRDSADDAVFTYTFGASAALTLTDARLDVQEAIAAAGSISGIGGSGVYARYGVANALLSSGTDVFIGRPSAIAGFTNGDVVLQSFAGSVKAVVGADIVGEFHATGLDLPVSGSEVEFTGSTGPVGIEFHPSSGVAAEWVDIYYRTTPDTLSIERNSDGAIFAEFFPATMTVDFPQLVTITGSSFIVNGPTRSDFIDSLIDVQAGISGSYSDNSDSGAAWGANIWSMGDAYAGSGYGTSYALNGNHYGLVWLRPSHSATPNITDEGLYIYRAGSRIAGFGRLGALFEQPLYLAERGAASADGSGWGQIWVLNSAPNRPYFTDDAGSDLPMIGGLLQAINNGNYTLQLSDIGKYLTKTSGGGGETFTIPANASVAFPSGTIIPIENRGGGNLSIAITTDTLLWPAGGGTGTRTLADNSACCLFKAGTNVWYIFGSGVS